MELTIEDRIKQHLDELSNPYLTSNEVDAIKGKIEYLRSLEEQ